MLASRILPPIIPRPSPPLPLATFVNIPRRYVKSNMQVGNDASKTEMEEGKPLRQLRKSTRVHEYHAAPTISNTVQHDEEMQGASSALSSPRTTKKRVASFDDDVDGAEFEDRNSPTDSRVPQSASSTGSGELSGHVCLCQPEPKIPRPRNGKSYLFFIPDVNILDWMMSRNKGSCLCLRTCIH